MKITFVWEKIAWDVTKNGSGFKTTRAKVIGGWLVKNLVWDDNLQSESMCFVSDVNHEWGIAND